MERRAARSFKVFLVEDSPLLRTRLEAMLSSVGAAVVGHAAGAQAAIGAILRARPDAVVLDLHLEEGNGFDVMKALQKSAAGIPVYVLTNFPSEPHRRKAAGLGARGFFDKSGELDKLGAALAAHAA
jgi:DNA-binding NarL/FixJ family response regulator